MAKYYITLGCGHKEEKVLFGKGSERERKIKWLEKDGLCSNCYKAQKEQEKNEQLEKAIAANSAFQKLTGTKKQIEWAEKIRATFFADISKISLKEDAPEERKKQFHEAIELLKQKNESKFWIENRFKSSTLLLQIVYLEKNADPVLKTTTANFRG